MLIGRLDDQATRDGSTRDLGADAHDTGRDESRVVVFVNMARLPDYKTKLRFSFSNSKLYNSNTLSGGNGFLELESIMMAGEIGHLKTFNFQVGKDFGRGRRSRLLALLTLVFFAMSVVITTVTINITPLNKF